MEYTFNGTRVLPWVRVSATQLMRIVDDKERALACYASMTSTPPSELVVTQKIQLSQLAPFGAIPASRRALGFSVAHLLNQSVVYTIRNCTSQPKHN
jgi:hypothetical protein